jgi:16S rRNA C1402 N4-methylase RsmH
MTVLALRKAPGSCQRLSSAVAKSPHIPVLLEPLTNFLQETLNAKSLIIDATFGAGGYSNKCLGIGYN